MEAPHREYNVQPTKGMESQARSELKRMQRKQQEAEAQGNAKPAPAKVAATIAANMPAEWKPVSETKKVAGVRDFRTYVFIGGKGSGKSSLAYDFSTVYLEKFKNSIEGPMGPRVIIHDYSSSKAFAHIPTVEDLGKAYKQYCKNELIKPIPLDHPLDVLKAKDKKGLPFWKKGRLRFASAMKADIELFHNYVFNYVRNALSSWPHRFLPRKHSVR